MKKYQKLSHGFYYDKIRINSEMNVSTNNKLPIKGLEKNSYFFSIRKASLKASWKKFQSSLEIVAPTQTFFQLLLQNETIIEPYMISHLEIARDTFYKTNYDAEHMCWETLKTCRKKFSSNHFIYDQRFEGNTKKRRNNPELFGQQTGYFGSDNFKYVVYARLSKINGMPCVHEEWRIRGAANIRKKTNISIISDLISFDLKAFFEDQYNRHICFEEIDNLKFGKWLLGMTRLKNVTKQQLMKIQLAHRHFCDDWDISTYADLVRFFKQQKKDIKSKRGRRSAWDIKILSLTDYSRFAKKIVSAS